MKPRNYFAGQSDHGSSTSYGFGNDWTVYVFDSKHARDKFVADSSNLSTKAILKTDVTRAVSHSAVEFSTDFYGIMSNRYDSDQPEGSIGTVQVCNDYNPELIKRLF